MSFKESQMGTSSTEYQESISEYAMQLTSASVLPSVLKAAIDLGVLEIIRKAGPGALLSASQIASELSTHSNDNLVSSLLLDCMLRVLASHSILTCSITHQNDGHVLRLYGLAPVSKYFDRNQDGGTLAPVLDFMQDKVIMSIWDHLKDAVLEGVLPFYKAHGVNMSHEFMGKEGRLRETFHVAHGSFNQVFMEKILETYKGFEGLKSLVDVGGGDGTILNIIISKYPSIKGVNFDLATVIEKLPPYPGIEHVAGDMFVNIPKGDAIFMKWMIHQHVDKDSLKVLKNCYEALPKRGKVIMVDMVVPEVIETSAAHKSLFQLYLFLLNSNSQGKERTKREFESLGKAAGFSSIQVGGFAYGYSLVEFYKNM
ncbi:caffeic acid 3-O-methyltransferase-like [Juglans microcarpa x Juglans regia]|uniref:caffeic acid 3-O-methyltransferase-like n=1 Tax=Juglans microcarpa x Juglans regia TaxID=2249226 RepID=UPI001B7E08A0|nr:caffeic acid 3-O-methyltransferase-like [Juglans microcarpa x Juglans regia]